MSAAARRADDPELEPEAFEIRFERAATPGDAFTPGKSARFYTMKIQRSRQSALLGFGVEPGWELVIERGRLDGTHASERREEHATKVRAIERWGHFCGERRERGYREIPKKKEGD